MMMMKLMMMRFLDCHRDVRERCSTSVSFSFFFRWCEEISSVLSPLRDENGVSRLVAPWFEFENFFRRGEARKTRDDVEKFQNFSSCLSLSLFFPFRQFRRQASRQRSPSWRKSSLFRAKEETKSVFLFLSFPVERATDRAIE